MDKKEILNDARNFIKYWVIKKKITGNEQATLRLDYKNELKMFQYHQAVEIAEAKAKGQVVKPIKIRPLTKDDLNDAFEEYLMNLPILKRAGLHTLVRCDKENLEPLRKWLTAVTGVCLEPELYVMAHWIWLVKRSLNELPVVHHIMPIITSPQKLGLKKQGGGKSTAITMLISPMEDVHTTLRMDQVSDDRYFTTFTNYLIGFLDEMAGSKKVEIEDFKRIVTAETLMYRPMRTNSQVRIKNLCSFIGASNNALPDIVRDTTGNRRFFQITALETLNHADINAIDYLQLWKGIDERMVRGYYEQVKQDVIAQQEEISTVDELEAFFDEYDLMPKDDSVNMSVQKLYDEYQLYSKRRGNHFQLRYQSFCHRIKALGVQTEKKRDGKGPRYLVAAVNTEHALKLTQEKPA